MLLDESMNRFRVASRELFNTHFRVNEPYENGGWLLEERFCAVEAVLFDQLVSVPHALSPIKYGNQQPEIRVGLRSGEFAPIMINREIDSGYWDCPIEEIAKDAKLSFFRFFDWDLVAVRDNRYVRVVLDSWPSHPELAGRHALVESQYVSYTSA